MKGHWAVPYKSYMATNVLCAPLCRHTLIEVAQLCTGINVKHWICLRHHMHARQQKLDCTHLFELDNVGMSQLLVVDNFPLHILTDLYTAANL